MEEWRNLRARDIIVEQTADYTGDSKIQAKIRVATRWGDRYVGHVFRAIVRITGEQFVKKASLRVQSAVLAALQQKFTSKQYKNYIFSHKRGYRWVFEKDGGGE